MILTLEVVSADRSSLGTAARQSFGPEGGTIGRARTSDWELPHRKVSGTHAVITCVNGTFQIEDTSTNGVFFGAGRERLMKGRPRALKSGDRLTIEPYEIRVTVSGAARAARSSPPNLETDDPFASPLLEPDSPQGALARSATQEVDPLKLLGGGEARKAPNRKVPTAGHLDGASPLAGHYRPPVVVTPTPSQSSSGGRPPVPLIPEDYDPLASDSGVFALPVPPSRVAANEVSLPDPFANDHEPPAVTPHIDVPRPPDLALAPEPVPRPAESAVVGVPGAPVPVLAAVRDQTVDEAPAQLAVQVAAGSAREGLALMLAGAGLDDVEVSDELARDFGRILRVVVEGLMDVLRARQQIKDEFRMRMTQFRPADNNPLKFSANADDALHNLLVKRNAAYLPPVEAFADAFDDLRDHQMAMLAGIRTAFDTMIAQFDPTKLQVQFDRQLKGGLLPAPAKLRYWELYKERCEGMLKDVEASFRTLFGEEFARAYEEQLGRLKAERRAVRPSEPPL